MAPVGLDLACRLSRPGRGGSVVKIGLVCLAAAWQGSELSLGAACLGSSRYMFDLFDNKSPHPLRSIGSKAVDLTVI